MTTDQAAGVVMQAGYFTPAMVEWLRPHLPYIQEAVGFARGGGGGKAAAKGGTSVAAQVAGAIGAVGSGGCGTGTKGGVRGFQKGNKCGGKHNRSETGHAVAAARSKHTTAVKEARKHITRARKSGTTLEKEGRQAVKVAAAAHRELQAARQTHQAAQRETRNLKRREAYAAKKAAAASAKPAQAEAPVQAPTKAAAEPRAEAQAALKAAQVTPRPGSTTATVTADRLSTRDFADRVVKAAQETPGGGFGTEKTFISHVKAHLEKTDPAFKGMSDEAFKARLLEANQTQHLELGRADLTPAMSRADVKASSTPHMGAEFHFVRHPAVAGKAQSRSAEAEKMEAKLTSRPKSDLDVEREAFLAHQARARELIEKQYQRSQGKDIGLHEITTGRAESKARAEALDKVANARAGTSDQTMVRQRAELRARMEKGMDPKERAEHEAYEARRQIAAEKAYKSGKMGREAILLPGEGPKIGTGQGSKANRQALLQEKATAAAEARAAKEAKAAEAKAAKEAKAAEAKAAKEAARAERLQSSSKEATGIKTERATTHLNDLTTGVKAGAFDKATVAAQVDRIAKGATKDELFAAAKAAGIEHTAKTKTALVEHLKGHIAGQAKPAEVSKPAAPKPAEIKPAAPKPAEAKPAASKPATESPTSASATPKPSDFSEFRTGLKAAYQDIDARASVSNIVDKSGLTAPQVEAVARELGRKGVLEFDHATAHQLEMARGSMKLPLDHEGKPYLGFRVLRLNKFEQAIDQMAGKGPAAPTPAPAKAPAPSPAPAKVSSPTPAKAEGLGPSKAKMFVPKGEEAAHAQYSKTAEKLLGTKDAAERMPGLVGATDDARVTFGSPLRSQDVEVHISSPRYKAHRSLFKDSEGRLVMKNESFEVDKAHQGKGIGTEVFSRQVEQARAAGVHRIVTDAAKGKDLNGYSTWAKLGYDAPLEGHFTRQLPEGLKGATRVSDLMKTPEGRKHWEQHGYQTKMTFDLDPGSVSSRVHAAYLAERAARRRTTFADDPPESPDSKPREELPGGPLSPRAPGHKEENPDFTEAELQAAERAWDRLASEEAEVRP